MRIQQRNLATLISLQADMKMQHVFLFPDKHIPRAGGSGMPCISKGLTPSDKALFL